MEGMECPVCLKLPRGPVYQCERGHHVCSECRLKLTNCPVCRVPLGHLRNLFAENLLMEMSHTCKFTIYGCTYEEKTTALESHEHDCKYRLIYCLCLDCQMEVSMDQLLKHLEDTHPATDVLKTNSNTVKSSLLTILDRFFESPWVSKPLFIQLG